MNGLSQTTSSLLEKLKKGYKSKNTDPAAYSAGTKKEYKGSEYASMARDVLKDYLDREDFSYNVNTDKLYSQYSDKAKRAGESAMRDTVARASELSGGYANSYAVNAGMQAYNDHLDTLNDIIPELEARAYDRYLDEGRAYEDKLSVLLGLDESEYDRYRDEVEDAFKDREFLEDAYRYREDADMDMYKALSDYVLELSKLENDDYFDAHSSALDEYFKTKELALAVKDLGVKRENNKYNFYLGLLDAQNKNKK